MQAEAYILQCVVNSSQNKTKIDSEDQADLYNSPTIEITNAAADAIQTTAVAILVFEQSDIILYIFWLSDKGWMNAMKLYETYETVL